MNGSQRVVTLVARRGWAGWGVSVSRREGRGKKVANEKRAPPSCWRLPASIYLCGVVIMQKGRVVPQRELPHLPVFPPVTLRKGTHLDHFRLKAFSMGD